VKLPAKKSLKNMRCDEDDDLGVPDFPLVIAEEISQNGNVAQ
jgi:hypothetical protein